MYDFKNKNGIIFGSTGFLGSRLAIKLTKIGANLILHGKSRAKLVALNKKIKKLKKNVSLIEADLTNLNFYKDLQKIILSKFSNLDFLIISIGRFDGLFPLTHITDKMWEDSIEINLNSHWRILKNLEPILNNSNSPKVILFTHSKIKKGLPFYNTLKISKLGIESLAETYNTENKRLKIKVRVVALQNLNRGMTSKIYEKNPISEKKVEQIIRDIIEKCFLNDLKKTLIHL
jgi:short-subunit dehydrogenase